jgi:N-dimethylarginine dimethylaminohydrolase
VVRVGKDIIIDSAKPGSDFITHTQQDYRLKLVNNGGHLDACFAVLKPGLLLANRYFSDYETTFPGWEIIMLDHPSFGLDKVNRPYPNSHGKFWDTTVPTNRMFNQHVIKHALDWVGCYTETYFELNCLVVNEKTVVMLGENIELEQQLNQHGIDIHWVPFRTRSFWDGAMHCLTMDVRRQSTIEDFFPERG